MIDVRAARTTLLSLDARLSRRLGVQPMDGHAGDEGDRAQANVEQHAQVIDKERGRARLLAIREALARLDRGEYGICVACGDEMGKKRLEAIPEVARCLACAEAEERRLRHGGERVTDDEEAC